MAQEVAVASLPLRFASPHDCCRPAAGRISGEHLRAAWAAGLAEPQSTTVGKIATSQLGQILSDLPEDTLVVDRYPKTCSNAHTSWWCSHQPIGVDIRANRHQRVRLLPRGRRRLKGTKRIARHDDGV